jgi:HTH-type transcriptional regulator/antitoxin HigA
MSKTLVPFKLIAPGETLKWALGNRGWTQRDLAEVMHRPAQMINEIIAGKKRITAETAWELAAALGTDPEFWLNLETSYQLYKAYKEQEENQIRERSLLKAYQANLLIKWGWIKKSVTLSTLKAFLGFDPMKDATAPAVNFRYSLAQEPQPEPLLSWVARARALAGSVKVKKEITLDEGISQILMLTVDMDLLPRVKEILARTGIILLFVPHLPHTYLDGAVLHIGKKPVIALTLRYSSIDCFWFTLMHELAHVYLGHKKEIFDDTRDFTSENIDEIAANDLAGKWLIPTDAYKRFVKSLKPERISEKQVLDFANKINRHPGIVVGRLQHDGLLSHRQLNKYHITIDEYFADYIDKPA